MQKEHEAICSAIDSKYLAMWPPTISFNQYYTDVETECNKLAIKLPNKAALNDRCKIVAAGILAINDYKAAIRLMLYYPGKYKRMEGWVPAKTPASALFEFVDDGTPLVLTKEHEYLCCTLEKTALSHYMNEFKYDNYKSTMAEIIEKSARFRGVTAVFPSENILKKRFSTLTKGLLVLRLIKTTFEAIARDHRKFGVFTSSELFKHMMHANDVFEGVKRNPTKDDLQFLSPVIDVVY